MSPINLGPGFSAPTLEELEAGKLPAVERRMTTLENPRVTTEYRTASYAQRLRQIEELSAEIDLKLSYLLED
jgi:hypothetical protein